MLALKNERHIVEASVPGLSDLARVSMDECLKALEKLSRPDKWSRNSEFGGRRIEKCDGGWKILNGEHYRRQMSEEDRKSYKAEWQREYRKRKKGMIDEATRGGATQALKEGFEDQSSHS